MKVKFLIPGGVISYLHVTSEWSRIRKNSHNQVRTFPTQLLQELHGELIRCSSSRKSSRETLVSHFLSAHQEELVEIDDRTSAALP